MPAKSTDSLYLRSPKLNQLLILRHLAGNARLTQAELARLCDLSVAMVNNYMRELCAQGYLEYRRKSIKSVTYHLTPEGHERIRSIEMDGIRETVDFYAGAKRNIREHFLRLAPPRMHRVVLFGRGHLAELVYHALETSDVRVIGVCDNEGSHIGREWLGREVMSPSQIRHMAPDAVLIVDTENAEAIQRSLSTLEERGIRVIRWDVHSPSEGGEAGLDPESSLSGDCSSGNGHCDTLQDVGRL